MMREDAVEAIVVDPPDAFLLRPAQQDALQIWRVDPKVNSNRYQEPDAIKPV